MSFLEELEQNKDSAEQESNAKSPRQLWESCFKYFKHFVSILQKDKSTYQSKFNFIFLNLISESLITGPFELKRTQDNNDLKLEVTFTTQLKNTVTIKRKDQRSAELLRAKLSKDRILSSVKTDKDNNFYTELNQTIPSIFRLILKEDKDFYIQYKNLNNSANRSIKLPIEKINQDYMDELAKYILGKNPSLYTESISNKEISKIRSKIELEKQLKAKREEKLKEIAEAERIQAEIIKANTLKEKTKRYIKFKSKTLKDKILNKIKDFNSK